MPIPVLTHMKATAIQVTMASKPVKILAPYLSPFRPLSGADLSACFDGGMPVLMAGDRNAKHVDWNSRLSTRGGNFLRDYCRRELLSVLWTARPTTNSYNPFATPGVLDIVIAKKLTSPVYLTVLC